MGLPFTLTEDKAFRAVIVRRLTESRVATEGYPHQHELWPCVRLGVAQRLLARRGQTFHTLRRALRFLRGHAIEARLVFPEARSRPAMVVYKGVAVRPDWFQVAGDPYLFAEVKSTEGSSYRFWGLVKAPPSHDLGDPTIPFRHWIEQVCLYCVALGTDTGGLVVHFLRGDYATQRTKCPECGAKPLPWAADSGGDLYKRCTGCGYKSYSADLRVYRLSFAPETLAHFDREVFEIRRGAFVGALEAGDALSAPPTPNFFCGDCVPGQGVGCEYYGGRHG